MGLKIAMVTTYKVKCGIATYSENLAHALSQHNVNTYIVRLPRFGSKTKEIILDVADRVPKDKVDCVHVQHEYGLYQGYEPDFYGYLKTLNLPISTTLHAVGNWQIDGGICASSNRVIVHNRFCAKRLDVPSVIIPHGCSPKECPPMDECKTSYGIDPRAKVVGYVGFISPYKGLETLFVAMSKVPYAGLLVGGGWHTTGPETQYIAQLRQYSLDLLQNRCQWLGYVQDKDLSRVYGAMNIVVYPSHYISESGALLMALSHGKAVIASDLAPVREKAKEGALMTFKKPKDLTKKIKLLLKDDELRGNLEKGARMYAQRNSWVNVAKQHIEVYEDAVSG